MKSSSAIRDEQRKSGFRFAASCDSLRQNRGAAMSIERVLWEQDATGLAELVHKGEISPQE
ncbi:MAG: hypothetical protein E5X19_29850, partial [Mesorhizobium sp.]